MVACPIVCGVRRCGEIRGSQGRKHENTCHSDSVFDGFVGCATVREGSRSHDNAWGEFGRRWGAGDSGVAGGDGGAIWVVSKRDFVGLASDAAGDADRDAIWGYAAASFADSADG